MLSCQETNISVCITTLFTYYYSKQKKEAISLEGYNILPVYNLPILGVKNVRQFRSINTNQMYGFHIITFGFF